MYSKLKTFLFSGMILFLILFVFPITSAVAVTNCQTLGSANTIYNVSNTFINSSFGSSCFPITANNITLNCGNWVAFLSSGTGGFASVTGGNVTIRNCVAITPNSTAGLLVTNTDNFKITDSAISNLANNGTSGITVTNTKIVNISNNQITGFFDNGISTIGTTDNFYMAGNNITYGRRGLSMLSTTTSGIIENNNFSTLIVDTIITIGASNLMIRNNNMNSVLHGINLNLGQNNTIYKNSFVKNAQSLYFLGENNTNISSNHFENDVYITFFINSTLIRSENNNYTHGLYGVSQINFSTYNGAVGSNIQFNLNKKYLNGSLCPSCTYSLTLYPSESSFIHSDSGNGIVNGSFTPSGTGIYSILMSVNDSFGNNETRISKVLVGASETSSVNYYIRNMDSPFETGHPQINRDDTGMFREEPSTEEIIYCTTTVQSEPAGFMDQLYPIITRANFTFWTNLTGDGIAGIEKNWTYSTLLDYNTTDITIGNRKRQDGQFDIENGWEYIDYAKSLTTFSIKVGQNNSNGMQVITNPTNLSVTRLDYIYPSTPTITGITYDKSYLLGAVTTNTIEGNKTNVTIMVVDAPTNLTLILSKEMLNYSISGAGVSVVNDSSTEVNITFTQNGIFSFSADLYDEPFCAYDSIESTTLIGFAFVVGLLGVVIALLIIGVFVFSLIGGGNPMGSVWLIISSFAGGIIALLVVILIIVTFANMSATC